MLDYYKKQRHVEIFQNITLEQFRTFYMGIALSDDKVPTASTLYPLGDGSDGSSRKYDAVIYYITTPGDKKPELSMDA